MGGVGLGHLVDLGLGDALLAKAGEEQDERIWVEWIGGLSHVGGEDAVFGSDGADGLGVVGEVELLSAADEAVVDLSLIHI